MWATEFKFFQFDASLSKRQARQEEEEDESVQRRKIENGAKSLSLFTSLSKFAIKLET